MRCDSRESLVFSDLDEALCSSAAEKRDYAAFPDCCQLISLFILKLNWLTASLPLRCNRSSKETRVWSAFNFSSTDFARIFPANLPTSRPALAAASAAAKRREYDQPPPFRQHLKHKINVQSLLQIDSLIDSFTELGGINENARPNRSRNTVYLNRYSLKERHPSKLTFDKHPICFTLSLYIVKRISPYLAS